MVAQPHRGCVAFAVLFWLGEGGGGGVVWAGGGAGAAQGRQWCASAERPTLEREVEEALRVRKATLMIAPLGGGLAFQLERAALYGALAECEGRLKPPSRAMRPPPILSVMENHNVRVRGRRTLAAHQGVKAAAEGQRLFPRESQSRRPRSLASAHAAGRTAWIAEATQQGLA